MPVKAGDISSAGDRGRAETQPHVRKNVMASIFSNKAVRATAKHKDVLVIDVAVAAMNMDILTSSEAEHFREQKKGLPRKDNSKDQYANQQMKK